MIDAISGELAAAEQHYRAALGLNPKSQVALLGLSVLLNKTRRPAEAESLLRIAGENTARPPAWQAKLAQNLGLALDLQGKSEQAIASWQRGYGADVIPPYVALPGRIYMARPAYLGPHHGPLHANDPSQPG